MNLEDKGLQKLNIVLVEPQIPQNTGNIARTCAATGAVLHLVRPMGFSVDDKKLKRAGLDYWYLLDIRYHDSWDAFLRTENPQSCFFFSTKAAKTYSEVSYPAGSYLVFGREDAGLPEDLLRQHYTQCVRLPMLEGARSLNLSNTVAVAVYEALRQQGFSALKTKSFISTQSTPKDGEDLLLDAED
jgi:tRNA (cytidine/uridine-2'-O-)-methyltransferase